MPIRVEHQRGAGDVAGMELIAREGSGSIFEQGQNQLAAIAGNGHQPFLIWRQPNRSQLVGQLVRCHSPEPGVHHLHAAGGGSQHQASIQRRNHRRGWRAHVDLLYKPEACQIHRGYAVLARGGNQCIAGITGYPFAATRAQNGQGKPFTPCRFHGCEAVVSCYART